MRPSDCYFEKVSHVGLGIALLFIAMGLIVMSATMWPVFGMLISAPALLIAAYFFTAPASPECRIG